MTLSSLNIRLAQNAATRSTNLLRAIQYTHPSGCPCHAHAHAHASSSAGGLLHSHGGPIIGSRRSLATPVVDPSGGKREYAFEMAAASIRFGPGCTKEVGMDFRNMGAKRVCVVTDGNVSKLEAMSQVVEGLSREGVGFTVYSKTRVEPKDSS